MDEYPSSFGFRYHENGGQVVIVNPENGSIVALYPYRLLIKVRYEDIS